MQERTDTTAEPPATTGATSIFAPERVDPAGAHVALVASQRQRLLHGVTRSIAENGYASTTIEDITSRAGVSKKTFYEHFENKLACFLAAYDLGSEGVLQSVLGAAVNASAETEDPYVILRASIRSLLDFVITEHEYARTFFIEVLPLGEEAVRHRAACYEGLINTTRAFHLAARSQHPEWPDVPPGTYEATVTAVHGLITTYVAENRTLDLGELEDTLVYVHLALLQIPLR